MRHEWPILASLFLHLHLLEEAQACTSTGLRVELLPLEFESLLRLCLRLQDRLQCQAERGPLEHLADPRIDQLLQKSERVLKPVLDVLHGVNLPKQVKGVENVALFLNELERLAKILAVQVAKLAHEAHGLGDFDRVREGFDDHELLQVVALALDGGQIVDEAPYVDLRDLCERQKAPNTRVRQNLLDGFVRKITTLL